MNLKLNDFKEKYYILKDRQIREFNTAKRRVEKRKRKIQKEKEKIERRKKRKEEKLEKLKKEQEALNPFDVKDEENEGIGEPIHEITLVSDSDSESSHSDSSESEKSNEDSDEDGLHAPISMHELRKQKLERKRVKKIKKEIKEFKKRNMEKKRMSKLSNTKAPGNNSGGFFRNSVLIKSTLNFFGRQSQPQKLIQQTEDENKEESSKLEN